MPQPIPFPHPVAKPTPRQPLTASDHLAALDHMLARAVAKGGVMHPHEVLHMRQSVAALRTLIEEEKHTERLKGANHD
jgi:hypothetical protein